jgi:hypothetical protein
VRISNSAWLLTLAVVTVCIAGCGHPDPTKTRLPTSESVVAYPQAIGIPYDRYILLRHGERLVALKVSARSVRGEHISYSWKEIRGGAGDDPVPEVRAGQGVSTEESISGRIDIPGLRLTWSRGSADLGWLYWPEGDTDFAVFSRPWLRQTEIDPNSRDGRWLEQKKYRR